MSESLDPVSPQVYTVLMEKEASEKELVLGRLSRSLALALALSQLLQL